MNRKSNAVLAVVIALIGITAIGADTDGCESTPPAKSSSGVSKLTVKVPTGSDGLTIEQRNIKERLLKDNEPGSIKHLYVISAYSGQVLIYSTVRGKVTSSGKRLSPGNVMAGYQNAEWYGFATDIAGHTQLTGEVLGDDGSYGGSAEYLYWFDTAGRYHQQYLSSGCILHISDQPLSIKGVVINMEITGSNNAPQTETPDVSLPATTITGKAPKK